MENLSWHAHNQTTAGSSVVLQELSGVVQYTDNIHFTQPGSLRPFKFRGMSPGQLQAPVALENGGWSMDCEGFPQKALEHWSYSSNEIINNDPVTGSSQALFNERDSNKEN